MLRLAVSVICVIDFARAKGSERLASAQVGTRWRLKPLGLLFIGRLHGDARLLAGPTLEHVFADLPDLQRLVPNLNAQ